MTNQEFKASDDKFLELNFNYLPEQIQWKMYRAKEHFMDFELKVAEYMNQKPSGPGEMMHTADSTPEKPMFYYGTKKPVPARFGLIAGDYFQKLRSVFDYLVWQLILANGKKPHKKNTAFPACLTEEGWNQCYERKLKGLTPEQIDLIRRIQPFTNKSPNGFPQHLEILDELTNENKHRQVLFTALGSRLKPELPFSVPHIELQISRKVGDDSILGESLLIYLAFQDGIIKGLEVTTVMSALMEWLGLDVLPMFRRFF